MRERPAKRARERRLGADTLANVSSAYPSPLDEPTDPRPGLSGDTHNTWAFAPLSDPEAVVVEGSAPTQRAWSTSKVLVLAAFLEHREASDLTALSPEEQRAFTLALSESDQDSLDLLRAAVPDVGQRMTRILRSIGDTETIAPPTREVEMTWTVREQVRFMAALHHGQVVNAKVSALILHHLVPVPSQTWGLGTIGATAYKGGWFSPVTETRQMGIVDGYAVAILTHSVGPAVLQIDGDEAHVEQLDRLASMLRARLSSG